MDAVWPSVLINGAVVIFLWGLVWRSRGQRLDRLEAGLGAAVEKDYCRLRHDELRDDLGEIKQGLREALAALRDLETGLARKNGEDRARFEHARRATAGRVESRE